MLSDFKSASTISYWSTGMYVLCYKGFLRLVDLRMEARKIDKFPLA